jgi:hypothetical protein
MLPTHFAEIRHKWCDEVGYAMYRGCERVCEAAEVSPITKPMVYVKAKQGYYSDCGER